MNENHKINYAEFPCADLAATKRFFEADLASSTTRGLSLTVIYSDDLEQTQKMSKLPVAQSLSRFFHSQEESVFTLKSQW